MRRRMWAGGVVCLLAAMLLACDRGDIPIIIGAAPTAPPTIVAATPSASMPTAALVVALIAPTPTAAPVAPTPTAASDYRSLMVQARGHYPYAEAIDKMWAVMMCESGGDPNIADPSNRYFGLFQYAPATWQGQWNPYRDASIYDPHAQIFATAKAWHDGYQGWWGCY